MKASLTLLALSFLHADLANAKALLAVFGSYVIPGKSYPVEWLSDSQDASNHRHTSRRNELTVFQYLELLLVRNNNAGWNSIQTLFTNRTGNPPGDTYTWNVDTNLTAGSGYGLWLQSTPIDPNVTTGYADLTEWFDIRFANGSAPVTSSSSGFAATTSATGSTITVNQSATATARTTATRTGMAQPASTGNTMPQHDQTLSKSAIIGIAVGVSVGVTILLAAIVTAVLLRRRRRKAQAITRADSKRFNPDFDDSKATRPSFTTIGTLVELPEDPKIERAEIPGQTTRPVEKDAGDVAPEKKTIPPEKPIELE